MKSLAYQQKAVTELVDKTIRLLNLGGQRNKLVFEATTGAGKTVMACQMLAGLMDELHDRGDSRYQEVAFIWFAPRKLHIQSYEKLKGAFEETRTLRPIMFDELDQNEGIRPGEILFVNWESVNKENNVMVREGDSSLSLYEITDRTKEEFGLPIVAIIDEEHMFWSKTADKSAAVLDRINPAVEIRISATPKTANPKEKVTVYRQDVIAAEMIKKEVVLNPEIELNFSDELELNANLIKAALDKRNQIAEAYKAVGSNVNPLLLIQLPNDTKESMTTEDTAIADQVKKYLEVMCGITTDNHRLAVWLAGEKENLIDLEKPDNLTEVLLFKEAIALGWDCPRAAVLLIFRKLQSDQFTIQTVGRIMRMPEQKHYQKEILNSGYVFTDIAKDKIQIVTADAGYILNNTITAHRRENLKNVNLPSSYTERPNVERNYLGPDFRKVLHEEARRFWDFVEGNLLFSLEELAKLDNDDENSTLPDSDDLQINENRKKVANSLRLDVKNINIEIPQDVHFQNEEQVLEVDTVKYARKATEIDRVFMAYIATKGHQFESKGRTDKIASYLLEILADFFGIYETEAKKVVLYHLNRPKFDRIIDSALERYARIRDKARKESAAKRVFKKYGWEVPEERTYDNETSHIEETGNHALLPFVQLNQASNPEKDFVAYLEQNSQYIDWWYKNGDKGKQHYAIEYTTGDEQAKSLFYVDFVIRMKNGHIYLFDTKSIGSDVFAPDKHNALLQYIKENTTEEQPLYGGVILRKNDNWLFSPLPIENTTDTLNWNCFYPQNA
ncbi:type III restriction endonuclease subunit R [Bacteroides xylanisolvens]|uniref:DEAD/DEAH box helicase n=1 Tax=Bacteroides xylanisolvens TaxID=371601 RepID=UPI00125FF308|nr:DEAD/DEAH box helicase family protein [Bacteroides xylanisolvens]KAB6443026.1 type III restriction endonuclease subunit R [Bacteroides xylanisolvens]KAB6458740.1 type III restriction endonuclease subunit R [Bacteroides xylanisolvens]MCS3334427.1 DEAD/DEAH box helicase family protein [Bacteroides xylanisolvens]